MRKPAVLAATLVTAVAALAPAASSAQAQYQITSTKWASTTKPTITLSPAAQQALLEGYCASMYADKQPTTAAELPVAERSVFCLVNQERAKAGKPALKLDNSLTGAARAHSQDMVARRFYGHVNPNGQDPTARARAFGYPGLAGENIMCGSDRYSTPRFAVASWMASPGHRNNILNVNAAYADTGVGAAIGSNGATGCTAAATVNYTQMFGLRG